MGQHCLHLAPATRYCSFNGKQILLQQPVEPLPMLTFLLGPHPVKPVIKAPLLDPSTGQAGLRLHVPVQAKSDQWGICRQHPEAAPSLLLGETLSKRHHAPELFGRVFQ